MTEYTASYARRYYQEWLAQTLADTLFWWNEIDQEWQALQDGTREQEHYVESLARDLRSYARGLAHMGQVVEWMLDDGQWAAVVTTLTAPKTK